MGGKKGDDPKKENSSDNGKCGSDVESGVSLSIAKTPGADDSGSVLSPDKKKPRIRISLNGSLSNKGESKCDNLEMRIPKKREKRNRPPPKNDDEQIEEEKEEEVVEEDEVDEGEVEVEEVEVDEVEDEVEEGEVEEGEVEEGEVEEDEAEVAVTNKRKQNENVEFFTKCDSGNTESDASTSPLHIEEKNQDGSRT